MKRLPFIFVLLAGVAWAQVVRIPGPGGAGSGGGSSIVVTAAGTDTGSNASGSNQSSIATSATNHAAGVFLAAAVRGAGVSTITLSNTAGDTWSHATVRTNAGTDEVQWFYTVSGGNASDVVTASFSSSEPYVSIRVYQVTGLVSHALDVDTTVPVVSSSTITSSSFTTTTASEVVFMVVDISSTGNTCTAGSGYTATQDSNGISCTQYQIFSSVQTGVTATITSSSGSTAFGSLVSFK